MAGPSTLPAWVLSARSRSPGVGDASFNVFIKRLEASENVIQRHTAFADGL